MNETYDAAQAVDDGFALLTEQRGAGWIWEVSPETVDTANAFDCVLAQLTGNYFQASDDLARMAGYRDAGRFAVVYGFCAPSHLYLMRSRRLTEEWRRRIRQARAAGMSAV